MTVASTTVRPSHGPGALTHTVQRAVSAPEGSSSARTDLSEPVTDVTVTLDTPGRAIRSRSGTVPTRAVSVSQPLSPDTPATTIESPLRAPETRAILGEAFVDARTTPAASPLTLSTAVRTNVSSAIANGSPLRRPASVAHVFALNASPGMSEGLSVQYEDALGPGPSGGAPSKTVKKWRLHFAKPPTAAEAMAIKPVTTAVLVEKLELDEETVSALSFPFCYRPNPPPPSPYESQRRSIDEWVISSKAYIRSD